MTQERPLTYSLADERMTHASPAIKPAIRYAFCLFVFSLLFEMIDLPVPVKVTTVTGAIFLLSTFLQPRMCFRQPPAAVWCFVAWTAFCFVQAVWIGSPHVDDIAHEMFVLGQSVMLFWVAYSLMLHEDVSRAVMAALAASCILLAVLQLTGITATVVDAGSVQERVSAAGQNPSDIATICGLGLVWAANSLFGRGGKTLWYRLSNLAVVALLGLTVMRTEARGALLALAAGVLMYLFQPGGIGIRIRNLALIVLAAGVFIVFGMRSSSMVDRFKQAESGKLAGRERIYPLAIGMVREAPVFGWGFVTNTYELGSRVNHPGMPRRDPHNLALFFLTSTGFVGASPAFAGLWFALKDAWKARFGHFGIVPVAMMVTVLIDNLSVTWYSKLFWIILGFACASWASQRAQHGAETETTEGAPA